MTGGLARSSLGWRYHWRCIWTFARRELRLWTYFRVNFTLDLLVVFTNFIIYMIIASFRPAAPTAVYGAGYASFLTVGLAVNTLMATAVAGPYTGLMDCWQNNRLETLMMSPISLPLFITGISVGQYARALMRLCIYLAGGALLFGAFADVAGPTLARGASALLVLGLALSACTGLGLAAASMVYLVDARGGSDPVRLVVDTLSGIAAGVYFPVQVLPGWLQWLACLVPQTYALDALRRLLLSPPAVALGAPTLPVHALAPGLPPALLDVLILAAYALLALRGGLALLKRGLDSARRDGRLSTWR